jgi:hypothetical protein
VANGGLLMAIRHIKTGIKPATNLVVLNKS